MSSAIDRVRTHAAHEVEPDQQNAAKSDHAHGDHFQAVYYKKKFIRKRARMEKPTIGRSLAKLSKRPERTATPRGAGAAGKHATAPKPLAQTRTLSWRDPYRQGGGNGRSGNQRDHDDDDDDGFDDEKSSSGKFSVSRKSHCGAVIALPDDARVYAASVSKLIDRQSLICKHGVQRLSRLPKAHAFNKAQSESHRTLTPLMAHQVFSLRRTRSQYIHALARKEGQVRSSPTPSSRAVHGTLLDLLAARGCDDEAMGSDNSAELADIIKFLRESQPPE